MMNLGRRMGRVRIRRETYDDNLAREVFKELLPVEVRYNLMTDGVDVIAQCDQFDEAPQGEDAPYYRYELVIGPEVKSLDAQGFMRGRYPVIGCRFIRLPPGETGSWP
jgi:hypothetical protein